MQEYNLSSNHVAALLLRITAGLVMLPHGAQLLLGWFGGNGFTNTMDYFVNVEGLPWLVGFLVIMIQFLGSLMLVFGLFTRLNAIGMFCIVFGMIFSHTEFGFFMNWFGAQKGEGYEFHLLLLGICAASIFLGSGKYSLDQKLFKLKYM